MLLTKTNKGKPSLVIDGFFFRFERESGLASTWGCSCCKKTCRARCKTNKANTTVIAYALTDSENALTDSERTLTDIATCAY